jgi:hypothetical protein
MQILMVSDDARVDAADVLLRERLAPDHLVSFHYVAQLAERLKWAAEDAERHDREVGPA